MPNSAHIQAMRRAYNAGQSSIVNARFKRERHGGPGISDSFEDWLKAQKPDLRSAYGKEIVR
jgi:hypothetical protein